MCKTVSSTRSNAVDVEYLSVVREGGSGVPCILDGLQIILTPLPFWLSRTVTDAHPRVCERQESKTAHHRFEPLVLRAHKFVSVRGTAFAGRSEFEMKIRKPSPATSISLSLSRMRRLSGRGVSEAPTGHLFVGHRPPFNSLIFKR